MKSNIGLKHFIINFCALLGGVFSVWYVVAVFSKDHSNHFLVEPNNVIWFIGLLSLSSLVNLIKIIFNKSVLILFKLGLSGIVFIVLGIIELSLSSKHFLSHQINIFLFCSMLIFHITMNVFDIFLIKKEYKQIFHYTKKDTHHRTDSFKKNNRLM